MAGENDMHRPGMGDNAGNDCGAKEFQFYPCRLGWPSTGISELLGEYQTELSHSSLGHL